MITLDWLREVVTIQKDTLKTSLQGHRQGCPKCHRILNNRADPDEYYPTGERLEYWIKALDWVSEKIG